MFLFAHVGITLGAAALASAAVSQWRKPPLQTTSTTGKTVPEPQRSFAELIGLKPLSRFLDIRLLLIGSMFPDIIDKPLEFLGFRDGRSIGHTLLVFLFFLLIGFYLYLNHKKTWILAIAIGIFTHLILDSMWANPPILLWPFYGWGFPTRPYQPGLDQIQDLVAHFADDPAVDISDGIGLAVLLVALGIVVFQKGLKIFLLKGKI